MDVGTTNGWRLDDVFTARDIAAEIDAVHSIEPMDPNYHGEVAKRWRYLDGSGEVGIISSVSQPFMVRAREHVYLPKGRSTHACSPIKAWVFASMYGRAFRWRNSPKKLRLCGEVVMTVTPRFVHSKHTAWQSSALKSRCPTLAGDTTGFDAQRHQAKQRAQCLTPLAP